MKEKKTYKSSWYEFTPDWCGFALKYDVAGYFTKNAVLQIYIIWGKLFLYLPWKHYKMVERLRTTKEMRKDKLKKVLNPDHKLKKVFTKEFYDECDPPSYGIYFHDKQFGINHGIKTKLYGLPWFPDWIRTSVLRKDGKWEHETPGNRKDFFENKWKNILFSETHPYSYTTKYNEVQNCLATITVEEREWRWKWFKWLKLTKKVRKDIEIQFSGEIGEKAGSWKGGCTGCSYEMLPNETPHETLKRMENERKF